MNFDSQVLNVPVEDIVPNRYQTRLKFEDQALQELADSIRQHGIIQPLVLRRLGDKYEIIAGERRYRAAKLAGLTTVPSVIAKIDEKTTAEVVVAENVQRKELTAIEEAKSYKALLDLGYMTVDMLAKKIGLPTIALKRKLELLNLCNEAQDAIMQNQISERHGRSLLNVQSHEKQIELLNKIINERLTVKQLDDYIKENINLEGSDDMNQDLFSTPLTLGETVAENDLNDLESQSANMNMSEPTSIFAQQPLIEPIPSPTQTQPVPTLDSIDSLDSLEPIQQSKPNPIDAINKIKNLVEELKSMGYDINLNTIDNDFGTSLNIELKK